LLIGAIVTLAGISLREQGKLIVRLLSRYTNEDHAVLWLAASDWMRLRPREPTFYGQPYGVNLESVPMGVLHVLGLSYGTALPLTLIGLAIGAWWVLAWGCMRRGWWLAALLATATPILLRVDHWVIVGAIGTGVGRFLGAVAAAVMIGFPPSRRSIGISIAVGGFAVAIDTAAGMLVIPAFAWAFVGWLRVPRSWVAASLGALVPAAWKAYSAWFEATHTDHALHAGWTLETSWEPFLHNWANPDLLFGAHTFELYPHGDGIIWLAIAFAVLSIGSRRVGPILSALCLLALLSTLGSLPKSLDGSKSLWFSASRMTLAAPMALWFVGCVSVHAFVERLWSERSKPWVGGIALLCFVGIVSATLIMRAGQWEGQIAAIEHEGLAINNMRLHEIGHLEERCERAQQVAREAGTRVVLFIHDRAANYACPALHRQLLTALPGYERRSWVLRALSKRPVDKLIAWGVSPRECRRPDYKRALHQCVSVADGDAVLLEFDRQPPLDVIHRLGFKIRPFGQGCHPGTLEGCGWWQEKYGS
jgi:hypothetical protein